MEPVSRFFGVDNVTLVFAAIYLACVYLADLVAWRYGRRAAARNGTAPAPAPAGPGRVGAAGRAIIDRLARLDVTPNQVTTLGLVLVSANALLFTIHRDTYWLGIGLILSYIFDALDGVIARRQGRVSKFGGYLDAVIDRYQELVTYVAIAWVTGRWAVAFFIITGSMLTSYNKARVAVETPIDNKGGWPDLLDRPKRLWLLCVALLANDSISWILIFGLWAIAVLTHFTALQRFLRARRMLAGSG